MKFLWNLCKERRSKKRRRRRRRKREEREGGGRQRRITERKKEKERKKLILTCKCIYCSVKVHLLCYSEDYKPAKNYILRKDYAKI